MVCRGDPFKDNFHMFRQNSGEGNGSAISDRHGLLFMLLALFWFLIFSSFFCCFSDSGRGLKMNLMDYQGKEMALCLVMKLMEDLRSSMRS